MNKTQKQPITEKRHCVYYSDNCKICEMNHPEQPITEKCELKHIHSTCTKCKPKCCFVDCEELISIELNDDKPERAITEKCKCRCHCPEDHGCGDRGCSNDCPVRKSCPFYPMDFVDKNHRCVFPNKKADASGDWEKDFDEFFQREYLGLLQQLDGNVSGQMAKSTMIWAGLKEYFRKTLASQEQRVRQEVLARLSIIEADLNLGYIDITLEYVRKLKKKYLSDQPEKEGVEG